MNEFDEVETVQELESLIVGSRILSKDGTLWQSQDDDGVTIWYAQGEEASSEHLVDERRGPFRVVHNGRALTMLVTLEDMPEIGRAEGQIFSVDRAYAERLIRAGKAREWKA